MQCSAQMCCWLVESDSNLHRPTFVVKVLLAILMWALALGDLRPSLMLYEPQLLLLCILLGLTFRAIAASLARSYSRDVVVSSVNGPMRAIATVAVRAQGSRPSPPALNPCVLSAMVLLPTACHASRMAVARGWAGRSSAAWAALEGAIGPMAMLRIPAAFTLCQGQGALDSALAMANLAR